MDKMLIAWEETSMRNDLVDLLRRQYDITVCSDGSVALELLESLRPMAAIIDVALTQLDGITVVEKALDFLPPITFCITDFCNDYVNQTLLDLGVGYVFRRPCQPQAIIARLEHFRSRIPSARHADPQTRTVDLLLSLHFAPHSDGFQYLKTAIPLYHQDNSQLLCKEIYGSVVQIYSLSGWKVVEHSIRNAIRSAWNACPEAWAPYFPGRKDPPTNKAFICRISHALDNN